MKLSDTNIKSYRPILSPAQLTKKHPLSERERETIIKARKEIKDILDGKSKKKLFIAGPCSIHDITQAKEYARKLRVLAKKVEPNIVLVMRTYFEKPRTSLGWKGYINDPRLDGSLDIEHGLAGARELLVYLAKIGLPAGAEALDPITLQYLADLMSWASVGARTSESQVHREMASGLSMPVGFKNNTQGSVEAATNAVRAARGPHKFFGIDQQGHNAIVTTKGNKHCHIILRGGATPNYDRVSVAHAQKVLRDAGLRENIFVDCSHGNSRKDYRNQAGVFHDVVSQMRSNKAIIGLMLESNLKPGNQPFSKKFKKGVSITDACIGWEETERLVMEAHTSLSPRFRE